MCVFSTIVFFSIRQAIYIYVRSVVRCSFFFSSSFFFPSKALRSAFLNQQQKHNPSVAFYKAFTTKCLVVGQGEALEAEKKRRRRSVQKCLISVRRGKSVECFV